MFVEVGGGAPVPRHSGTMASPSLVGAWQSDSDCNCRLWFKSVEFHRVVHPETMYELAGNENKPALSPPPPGSLKSRMMASVLFLQM